MTDGSPSADSLVGDLERIEREVLAELVCVSDAERVEQLRVEALGRKSGRVTAILKSLGRLDASARPRVGEAANRVKVRIGEALDGRLADLADAVRADVAGLDVTMPGRRTPVGRLHPLTLARREIEGIFTRMGFGVVSGPEIEDDWHNFEALNMPPDHPARDMQDTFYLPDGFVMRTHTSPVQIRVMENGPPPVRIVVPGRVYRRDSDATHSPMFHQIEGLAVDEHITFADLKGTLTAFLTNYFGSDRRVRFRPSFFPFTEPSAEVDVWSEERGWLEVLGCGMVDPAVFEAVGYDPEEVTGFAFGLGVERLAMLKYGVDDLRLFFENDLRFLRQFA